MDVHQNLEAVRVIPIFLVVPFVLLLGAIAVGPLHFPNWWGRHYAKVAIALAALVAGYYIFGFHAPHHVWQTVRQYIGFMALIGSLFVVSGGIHITIKGEATPRANVIFLLAGAVLCNVLGTTGASMLLIRPWLRMNKYRVTAHHVVFFIFIVANVGGCLTPIADPPLFLGYLEGVPFWWTLGRCLPMWFVGVGLLLAMFWVIDRKNYFRTSAEVRTALTASEEWRFEGLGNLLFLAVILAAATINHPDFLRELLMIGAAMGSYYTTKRQVHQSNHFTFGPLREVAILFAGIFGTMMPTLDWVAANATKLGNPTPTFFYYGGGTLSSVLDSAPTYLCFLKALLGRFAKPGQSDQVASVLGNMNLSQSLLAISIGTVFFGANTYIGNGPNFMIKAICEEQKVRAPTFFGYIWKYTLPFMVPMLVVVWLAFFS